MMISIPLGLALATLPRVFAATYDVSVGADGLLRYNPQTVHAVAGDIVNFVFHPKNHTVTQSTFDSPCSPVLGGVDSGFQPVAAGTTALPTFQHHVRDSSTVWIYCQQVNHCKSGMVFAINPPSDSAPNSFAAFQAKAQGNVTSSSTTRTGYVTPPPPSGATVTATVTAGSSTYTTTYYSYAGTPPPTPAPQPVDHKIIVGDNGQLSYSPANISAAIGDTVTFEFRPKNHTVTQSSFSAPCQPLADTSADRRVGFTSGFVPVAPGSTTFPTFRLKINDTAPIWGYCGQRGHCGAGMVFSINAVESGPNNFAAYQELAKRINGTTTSSSAAPSASSSSPASSGTVMASSSNLSIVSIASLVLLASMYFL